MALQKIIPSLTDKIKKYANSQKELCYLLEDFRKIAEKNLKTDELEKLLTQICAVEDTIDSIIAIKMLQRQSISIEKVFVKYFVIAKGSVKFPRKLRNQSKLLKKLNVTLSVQVSEEKFPAKESSSNTVPQNKSSTDAAVLSKKPNTSEAIQVSSGNKDVWRDSSVLKDLDESHHQSWEKGSVPVVLEELVSKLAQPGLLSRRMRQLHILKVNLEYPSDVIFLSTSYHSYDAKQHFQFRCWVVVSKESGERNILSDILKQVPSIKQEELNLSNQLLRKRLRAFLAFKRYLIVLYGEQRDEVWNSLKSAFPYLLNGSRVLLISKGLTSTNVSKEWSRQQLRKFADYLLEESSVLGTKDIINELYQLILKQCKLLFVISIVGVVESEETTFLRAMYDTEEIKRQFKSRAWVRVPKDFHEKDLLADILQQVADDKVEEGNLDPAIMQEILWNFLAPKRYLVVLYDVWTVDIWDKVKHALPNSMNGSRVILTVREANVAGQTNCSWIFGTVCGKELLHEKVSHPKVKRRWGRLSDVKNNESGLVGLADKVQELAKLLLDSNQFLISVVGVAGSGKMMLVKAICNSLAIEQHFDCQAFASVSQVFEERKLLADFSMQLGMVRKDESWSKEELQKRLKIFLAWKRYLIVLNDVDEADVWERLSPAFPYSSNGSRVIIMTRDASVTRHINLHTRVIQLRLLDDDESWELFVRKVPRVVESAELMEAFREKILQTCGGLPLDIVVLGGLLSTKEQDIRAWSKVIEQANQRKERKKRVTGEDGLNSSGQPTSSYLKQENVKNFLTDQSNSFTQHGKGEIEEIGLSEAQLMHEEERVKHGAMNEDKELFSNQLASSNTKLKEDNQNTSYDFDQDQSGSSYETFSHILALGYQNLDSDSKFCLDYLGLFPKLYKVPFRRFFHLLQAEGILMTIKTTEGGSGSFEDKVKKHIEDLETRNMINVEKQKLGSPKTICLQRTVYEALSLRAVQHGLFYIHSNRKPDSHALEQPMFIRRLADHTEINDGKLPKCSFNLRSYISFKTEKGLLKEIVKGGFGLLVVLDLEKVFRPVLSNHLGKFPNLKYLGLRRTFLDSVPDAIGDLPCLETLDVKHTNIVTLPSEFWKATHLQYLYMNNICIDSSIPKASSSNRGSLAINLQVLLGVGIYTKQAAGYLKATGMNGLRKLGVTCYEESIDEMVGWICQLTTLQSLKLRSINKSRKPSTLKLGDLRNHNELSQLYLFGELKEELDVTKFPSNLEILTLAVSKLSDDPMKELGKLKSLKILRLHARSFIGSTLESLPNTFPKLQALKLWMLEELTNLTVEKGAMPALEEVEIRCCNKLKNIVGLKELTTLEGLLLTNMKQDFVKELKESLGSNVSIVKENNWKFSSTWE